jgi:hypothetical protein
MKLAPEILIESLSLAETLAYVVAATAVEFQDDDSAVSERPTTPVDMEVAA